MISITSSKFPIFLVLPSPLQRFRYLEFPHKAFLNGEKGFHRKSLQFLIACNTWKMPSDYLVISINRKKKKKENVDSKLATKISYPKLRHRVSRRDITWNQHIIIAISCCKERSLYGDKTKTLLRMRCLAYQRTIDAIAFWHNLILRERLFITHNQCTDFRAWFLSHNERAEDLER